MIRKFFVSNKKQIFLFLLMLVLELAMIFVLSQRNGLSIFFRSDGSEYQRLVLNLIDHGKFSLDNQTPFISTDYRTPVYPAWLAIIYLIFKSFKPAIFIGAAIFALSAPLVYIIGKEIFGEKIAFWSAVLFAVEPWAIFQGGFLAAEQIAVPVFFLAIYLFCRYLKSGKSYYIYWASAFSGVAALIRPATLYFVLIFAVLAFISELRFSVLKSFKTTALVILIFIAVLSPWLIRNKIVLNTWQMSSAASNGVLYIESYILNKYLGKITDEPEWRKAEQILGARGYNSIRDVENAKILADYAIGEIKSNKIAFITMHLKNMALFWVKNSYGNIFLDLKINGADVQSKMAGFFSKRDFLGLISFIKNISVGSKILILISLFWPVIIFLAILGAYNIFKKDYRNLLYWFLLLWILYFPALMADFHDISRYKLSINAPLFMLAVIGFYKIKNSLIFNRKNE